jgi:hypothetical protein
LYGFDIKQILNINKTEILRINLGWNSMPKKSWLVENETFKTAIKVRLD